MPVIPQLDLLRVADAVRHPAFRAVVFHQHGRGGGEHPVAARGLGLPVPADGTGHRVGQHLPALIHPAGEDQDRAERDGEVERRFRVAGPLALRQAAPAMVDGLLQPPVQHVSRSQARAQLGPFPVRPGPSRQAVQGRLQRGDPGGEVIAEQMPDRDHARHQRGRGPQVARPGGQLVRGGVGIGRGDVVVRGRSFVAERGEHPGARQRGQLGRQVARRPPVQFQCLAMRRDRSGLGRGVQRVPVGEPGLPGLFEMRRDEGVTVAAGHGRPGHSLMQAAPLGDTDFGVQGVADKRMAEIETGIIRTGQDEIGILQFAQRTSHLVRVRVGDGGEQVKVEGTPDHGGGRGHVPGGGAQVLRAAQHGIAQRVRDGRRLHRRVRLRGQRVVGDGGEQLFDVQRDAVAALLDGRDHPSRSWAAEGRAGHRRGLAQGQAGQPDLLGQALAHQAGPQFPHGQPGIELVAAVRPGHQNRPLREPRGQVAEHVEAQVVGPVQVLEDDQHGPAEGGGHDRVGQILHEQAALVVRVPGPGGQRPRPCGQDPAHLVQLRIGMGHQAAGQVQQQPGE